MKIVIQIYSALVLIGLPCFSQSYIVAVTPFEVIGDSVHSDILGYGIPESISNDLSEMPDIQVVERLQLSAVLQELRLHQSGFVTVEKASDVGELLGANLVVTGTVQNIRGLTRIHARVVQVATGEVLFSVKGDQKIKKTEDYFTLEDKISRGILVRFGFHVAEDQLDAIGQKVTDSENAFRAFSTALKGFDSGDYQSGLEEIEKAREADPAFDWAGDIHERAAKAFKELERETGEDSKNNMD